MQREYAKTLVVSAFHASRPLTALLEHIADNCTEEERKQLRSQITLALAEISHIITLATNAHPDLDKELTSWFETHEDITGW